MRLIIQRVSEASVTINGSVKSAIQNGLLLLVGIEDLDDQSDIDWLCQKVCNLRIFNDADGKMNVSITEADGDVLVISQFTLHASTKKGNRPSFIKAAKPNKAIPLYKSFIHSLEKLSGKAVSTGEFGADMKVALINDGPVTIQIDSRNRE